VAFGLNNLLAEAFYDTGKFRPVEEKNLRQRQVIKELVELFWSGSRPELSRADLEGIAGVAPAHPRRPRRVGGRSSPRGVACGADGAWPAWRSPERSRAMGVRGWLGSAPRGDPGEVWGGDCGGARVTSDFFCPIFCY
jgi:hypothetical protein